MSRGYTLGTYLVDGTTVYVLNDGGTNRIHCSVNSGWKYGYDTINQKDERTSAEECEATARLFAAAPDLLNCLEEAVKAFKGEFGAAPPWWEDIINKTYGE